MWLERGEDSGTSAGLIALPAVGHEEHQGLALRTPMCEEMFCKNWKWPRAAYFSQAWDDL